MNGQAVVNYGQAEQSAKQVLQKIHKGQTSSYVMRDRSSVCSFYAKGNCKRGPLCPFLHEMPDKKIVSATINKDDGKKDEQVSIEQLIELPLVPAPGKQKEKYPSQNPAVLGTTTRSFRSK